MQREKGIDSISARASSPWDKFSSSPSLHSDGLEIEMRRSDGIPRLAPEVEQGNVEYKLILMNPTPERLQRLVTQMNWRLMEGNGEAYYQLGVADSGELIGLTKKEMEATLETLENMAGELGASVIISREIEVRGRLNVSLALDSINGMGGKDMNGTMTSSSASSLLSTSIPSDNATTDAETSEAEGESDQGGNATDSPSDIAFNAEGGVMKDGDPNEIIVRSAPVPITPSFLRRQRNKMSNGFKTKVRERTLRPQDFSPSPEPSQIFGDEGDYGFGDVSLSGPQDPSAMSPKALDPTLPPKAKTLKPPKPSKSSKQSKGAKSPTIVIPTKTPEQVAQKLAERRAKRDQRREERKRALMDPIYDHTSLATQDGSSGGINYESIVRECEDHEQSAGDGADEWDGTMTSPSDPLMSSLATLKPDNSGSATNGQGIPMTRSDPQRQVVTPSGDANIPEPRLIVEALVVRKAGFGRAFMDLSQFDEELAHLPSFSLS